LWLSGRLRDGVSENDHAGFARMTGARSDVRGTLALSFPDLKTFSDDLPSCGDID
jgi:hypothetical protein